MSLQVSITENNGKTAISGALTRATVPSLGKHRHHKIIKKNADICVDLSQLTKVDTAGLAWLLLVLEQAKKHQCQVSFAHIPNDLLKLAQLSAVESLLRS